MNEAEKLDQMVKDFQKHEIEFGKFQATSEERYKNLKEILTALVASVNTVTVDHDKRLDELEKEVIEIKADNINRAKNHITLFSIGNMAAAVVAVIAGILIDHFFLGG